MQPPMFSQTEWTNPTDHEVKFSIFVGQKQVHPIKVPPRGSVRLPSEFDNAIRTVRDGVVVGGLAPQLVAKGKESLPIHEAIAKSAALGEAERKLVAATGVSAGGLSIDLAAQMHASNEALSKRVAELEALLAEKTAPAASDPPAKGDKETGKAGR